MKKINICKSCLIIFLLVLDVTASSVEVLKETSNAFKTIAKDALPAVVFIDVEKTVEVESQAAHPFFRNDPFFDQFFGRGWRQFDQEPEKRERKQQGQGSGFIISSDGYILTNSHVVDGATRITVTLADDTKYDAKLIGADPKTEVALIKLNDGDNLPIVELGDSDKLEVGEWVLAAGSPFGLSQSVTAGIVSALGRDSTQIAEYGNFIQTDAAINPGNSGGPLLNIYGKVVGINTAIITRSGGNMGVGFAIPINQAVSIKDQLITSGKVSRSVLGIYIQNVNDELAKSFGWENSNGILISDVIADSAAEEAGLQGGDIIVEFEGEPTGKLGSFRNKVAATPPNTKVKLKIFRDGKFKSVNVTTRAMDQLALDDVSKEVSDTLKKIGITVTGLDSEEAKALSLKEEDGVLIAEVEEGSTAWRAGIQPGQVITSVNRQPVGNIEEFSEAIDDSMDNEQVLFLISDGSGSRFVVIKLEK